MNTDFTIEVHDNYIHVRHAPGYEINRESAAVFWTAITEACKLNNCNRVFREGKDIIRNMSTMDVFESAEQAARNVRGLRVAYCFNNYPEDELSRFLKTAAINRGVEVEFFSDRKDALKWLGVEEEVNPQGD
jgi:hypothetical protein